MVLILIAIVAGLAMTRPAEACDRFSGGFGFNLRAPGVFLDLGAPRIGRFGYLPRDVFFDRRRAFAPLRNLSRSRRGLPPLQRVVPVNRFGQRIR